MRYYLILIILFSTPMAFADQVSPHMRCADSEKMTWSDELQKHECNPTTFVKPEQQACETGAIYFWDQTGISSYVETKCYESVIAFKPMEFPTEESWDQYAWDFVFSGRFGW